MRRLILVLLLCLPLLSFAAAPSIPLSEYRERRAELRKVIGAGVVILLGNVENERGELRGGFFQNANFYYLTGWTEPGAVMVLTPKTEVLLIPRRDAEHEKWTGRKAAPGDSGVQALTGFDTVLAAETFEVNLPGWVESGSKIYTLLDDPRADGLKRLLPLRELANAAQPIATLRMKKSPAEIAMVQHATDTTLDAHRAAWKHIKPGTTEFAIASIMTGTYFSRGCERNAYTPIVGSGPNGAVLHYSKNRRTIDRGDLVLMDVGAECGMYASDITRTVPSSGKFTARQRELYEIVLGAQKAAIAAVKPGVMMTRTAPGGPHQVAVEYFNSHGKDRHGKTLSQYFTHGIGHHVGLDVHDLNDPTLPLAPGMVITIEPGLYIPEEGIGIRIEDVVLVTENGAKVLSSSLPREIAELETAMAK